MQHPFLKSTLAIVLSGLCAQSMANGLAINEQSVSSMGTAFAGRSSSALDASTVFGNPAGMSKLKQSEISVGAAFVVPSTDISDVRTNVSGTSKGDIAPKALVPFAYFVTPINEDFHFGLGLYVPYGVISDNEKAFQGRSHGLYSKVQVTTLQPTISYKISPKVSIGFGPTINKIDGKLTSAINTSALGLGGDTKVSVKGDDIAYGYNLGLLADVTDNTSVGLTYHSKVKYKLEGSTKFDGPSQFLALQNLSGSHDAKLGITLPEMVDLSITHKIDENWTVYAGSTWTRWSRLEELLVENQGLAPTSNFARIQEDMGWRDTWAHAIGASYQLNPEVVLRAGYAIDQTPTVNAHRSVRIPVGDRQVFTLGAGWTPTPEMTIDVAYAYIHEEKVSVNYADSSPAAPGVFLKPAYSANYKNSAHGVAAQLSYRF